MKRTVQTFLFLLMISALASSQQINTGLQTGLGTYSMTDLKQLNKETSWHLPFESKVVADFPPYIYFRPFISVRVKNVNLGVVYSYYSTGSRISARDYSGEYRFDMTVNASAPGFFAEADLSPSSRTEFTAYAVLGLLFSDLKMEENLTVLEEQLLEDNMNLKSEGLFFEPGFSLKYPVKFIIVGINTGFMISMGNSAFHAKGDRELFLVDQETEDPVKPQWDGFRLGVSLSFVFN